jgi:hypothetical protein
LRAGEVALRQRHHRPIHAHRQVRRHELERVIEGLLGLGVMASEQQQLPEPSGACD